MILSPIIERPRLSGEPYIFADQPTPEAIERVLRSGRPVLRDATREAIARTTAAEIDHLKHPLRWVARRRRAYEIDRLTESYKDVLRASPVGAVYHGMGSLVGVPSPLAPIAIARADGLTVHSYICADLDIAISTGVSAWGDQVDSNDWANATGSQQPSHIPQGVNNSRGYVAGDGSSRWLLSALNLPGTSTPSFWFGVWLQASWTNGQQACGGFPGTLAAITSTPQVRRAITAGGPAISMTLGTWFRLFSTVNSTTADYLTVGATTQTGVDLGDADPSSSSLFASVTGTNPGHFSCACNLLASGGDLSAAGKAAMDQWVRQYYGSVITL